MFAIIIAGASAAAGRHVDIATAADAARTLRPVAGRFAEALCALGFIGSGMLPVPVLAGAGSAAMTGLLERREGFSRSLRDALVFYGLVAIGTVGGTILTLIGAEPIKLLVFVAVLNH